MNGAGKEKGAEPLNSTPKTDSKEEISHWEVKHKPNGKRKRTSRNLPLERLIDSLLATGEYFDEGHLAAERVVADALLLHRLIYPSATAEHK